MFLKLLLGVDQKQLTVTEIDYKALPQAVPHNVK